MYEKETGREEPSILQKIRTEELHRIKDERQRKEFETLAGRLQANRVTWMYEQYADVHLQLVNVFVTECFSCKASTIWVEDKIVYPVRDIAILPHPDMPGDLKHDFDEAVSIVDKSPRGAAALLRLMFQKLMPHLGEKGKNLNNDIASLVAKGLDAEIQMAMDVLRVIGNNAVHPGQIDLRDDKAIAMKLFDLLSLIIERRITTPKRVKELFHGLPADALDAIQKRDGT